MGSANPKIEKVRKMSVLNINAPPPLKDSASQQRGNKKLPLSALSGYFRLMIKVCATGNDFLVVDLLKNPSTKPPSTEEILSICHRQNGFGADGFVILKPHTDHAFQWDFYNSDGSQAEMCGNAARAVARYYAYTHRVDQFQFLTKIGLIKAQVEQPNLTSGLVHVHLPLWKEHQHVTTPIPFSFVNTGVPHAVVDAHQISDLEELKSLALKIKALPQFQAFGVNVTFKTNRQEKNTIQAITFERGVENFTLSCGTGAIAAAVCHAQGKTPFDVVVHVPGGVLSVQARSGDAPGVTLSGEGRLIGSCFLGVNHEP